MHKVVIFVIGIVFFISCKQNKSFIPYVPVNVVVNTLDPEFQSLNGIGGWAYVDGGSKGIIIFRTDFDKFMAYDRHCTYKPSNSCSKVNVDENSIFAVDTCCDSKFQLLDGNPIEGPAPVGLQQYNTSFDGNIIQIWN
jgi:nitrite reductase/ring-hydroxylating ferredoxin subunit